MIYTTIFILIVYSILIGGFIVGFDLLPVFKRQQDDPLNKFSIVVPFRDEAKNLPDLIKSIHKLNYPQAFFEVLFVDDGSEDASVDVIERFFSAKADKSGIHKEDILRIAQNDISILKNNRKTASPKKDAIETAISYSKYEWIVTTDADCILPENWLILFDAYIWENGAEFIAAPVSYHTGNGFLHNFQQLELLSLQGSTIGAFAIKQPFLCNGANLCYSKSLFRELNGFTGNDKFAGGDDVFLLEKAVKHHPEKVKYLKSKRAIVITKSQPSWNGLLQQRLRWAAKATGYKNPFSKLVGISVLAMNVLLLFLLITSILGYNNWTLLCCAFCIKFTIDNILLIKTAIFFDRKNALWYLLFSGFLYPFFSMFVVVRSLLSSYQWKGRTFKN